LKKTKKLQLTNWPITTVS